MFNFSCYYDFGAGFGRYIWPFIQYPSKDGVLSVADMNDYLASLFTQMKGVGQNTIILSFAQVDNINIYSSGNFNLPGIDVSSDAIALVLNSLEKHSVTVPGYVNFLTYLVAAAHSNQMKIVISFGGQAATDASWKILQTGETYQSQAQKLANFLIAYQFDGVDFDIEDLHFFDTQKTVDSNGNIAFDFFQLLHKALASQKIKMTLTSMLASEWRTAFAIFLGDFTNYFDGLNLMAYSNTAYWLDPITPSGMPDQGWTIQEWIEAIGVENASLVNIGFDDGISYADAAANGGQYSYSIAKGSSDGEAAGQIYQQLLNQLAQLGYSPLGNPFFWPTEQGNNATRYDGAYDTSVFVSKLMEDFYTSQLQHGSVAVTIMPVSGLNVLPGPILIDGVSFDIKQFGTAVIQSLPVGTNYMVTAPNIIQGSTVYTAVVNPVSVIKGETTPVIVSYIGKPLVMGTLGIQIQQIANLPLASLPNISVSGCEFSFSKFGTYVTQPVVPGVYTIQAPKIVVGGYEFVAAPVTVSVSEDKETDATVVYTSASIEEVTATVTISEYTETAGGLVVAFQTTGAKIATPWTALISGSYASLGSAGYSAEFSVTGGVITADVTSKWSWNSIEQGSNAAFGVTVEIPVGGSFVPTSITVNGNPCNIVIAS